MKERKYEVRGEVAVRCQTAENVCPRAALPHLTIKQIQKLVKRTNHPVTVRTGRKGHYTKYEVQNGQLVRVTPVVTAGGKNESKQV